MSSFARLVLPPGVLLVVSEEEKHVFHFIVQCVIKQLLDSVFVIYLE